VNALWTFILVVVLFMVGLEVNGVQKAINRASLLCGLDLEEKK
jgi:hypothetical protein